MNDANQHESQRTAYSADGTDRLLVGIIMQACSDYIDARICNLINDDNTINNKTMERMIRLHAQKRCRFPLWMEAPDIVSCVEFLFHGDALDSVMPSHWEICPSRIREKVTLLAKRKQRLPTLNKVCMT